MNTTKIEETGEMKTLEEQFNYSTLQRFILGFIFIVISFVIIVVPILIQNIGAPLFLPATIYGTIMTSLTLIATIKFKNSEKYQKHTPLIYLFFMASCTTTVFGLINSYILYPFLPRTQFRNAWWTAISTVVMCGMIIGLTAISKRWFKTKKTVRESLYLQKGKLVLGLILGVSMFAIFFILQVWLANANLFDTGGHTVTWSNVRSWLFPSLTWSFANGFREELWARGMVFQKTEPYLGKFGANFVQALPFAVAHLTVSYVGQDPVAHYIFVGICFIMALIWGWMLQKTKSLIGPSIAHAGIDLPITLAEFASLM